MSSLKLYRISWSCQNLSNLFLNVSTVSAQTTASGRLFQSKTTLLAKLNFLIHYERSVFILVTSHDTNIVMQTSLGPTVLA